MYRFLSVLVMGTTLLFGYQKGDVVSPEVAQKIGLTEEKIYVIDFFASWCDSCKREMPTLSRFSDASSREKIEVIGIDVDQDPQKAAAFQKEMKEADALTFRVINDPKGEIIRHFDPVGMPALYVIRDGKVTAVILGAKDHIDKILHQAVKEAP